jgi:molecular chaperone DnaK (HSP70)
MATDNLKQVTGIYDASLGAPGQEQSGRAIIARQREGDNSNYHFMSNLSIAIHHIGRILIDMIPTIYDTARTIRILGEDMTDKVIEINQQSQEGELYDLSVGEYEIMVDVGPTYETKRSETAQNLINVITALPNVGQVVSDILMRQLDFPLSSEAADRLKRLIQQTMPGVIMDDEKGGKMSESDIQNMVNDIQKLQAMHSQSMQENMQLAQLVNDMKKQLKDKSDQTAAHLQETIIKAQTELQKSHDENAHDVIMSSMSHGVDLHKMTQGFQNRQAQQGLRVNPAGGRAQPAQQPFQPQPIQQGTQQ